MRFDFTFEDIFQKIKKRKMIQEYKEYLIYKKKRKKQ